MNAMQFALPPGTVARIVRAVSHSWESELSWATQQGWRVLAIFEETIYENQEDRRRRNGESNVYTPLGTPLLWITTQSPCFLLVQDEGTAIERLSKAHADETYNARQKLEEMTKDRDTKAKELSKVQNLIPTPLEIQVMEYKALVEKQQAQITLLVSQILETP